ncbi:MAG TPA: hypothetical protein VG734_24355 [Lacunisphaera sp.]|nr:hypothetical protein [Lacunisphaera sp.]
MKWHLPGLLAGLSVCGAGLRADFPSEAGARFLRVPDTVWSTSEREFEHFATASLPADLVVSLAQQNWGEQPGPPAKLWGFHHDLNGDGSAEYFIVTPHGGTAGPSYLVLACVDRRWQVILRTEGFIHQVEATQDRWPDLVVWSRGGGDNYAKVHHRFRAGEYQRTLLENFDDGLVSQRAPPP